MNTNAPLCDQDLDRYSRQIMLKGIGFDGQEKISKARILVIGAGGLGSPILAYLASAGIGVLGIVDADRVELSNLQRQIIHDSDHIGLFKTQSATERLEAINPNISLVSHTVFLNEANATKLIKDYDLVIDGSDNFTTRYLVNKVCYLLKKTLITAALMTFEGQITTIKTQEGGPCYQCIFPHPPKNQTLSRCDTLGVLGPIAGVLGSLQATEALKEVVGIGSSLFGTLLLYNGLETSFYPIKVKKQPHCPTCG